MDKVLALKLVSLNSSHTILLTFGLIPLFGLVYGISTIVGYLMLNPILFI